MDYRRIGAVLGVALGLLGTLLWVRRRLRPATSG